jgi:periplasmic copper chaperone A
MRVLKVAVLSVGIGLLGAGPASAHVTVAAQGATPGASDATITFRVPTESATLKTTGLKVQLPVDTPIASVLIDPTPGWATKVTTTKLAKPITTDDGEVTEVVSEVDWTAQSASAAIPPGSFGAFTILAGQLPDAPQLTFKAIQTYSDGSQVAWIEIPAPGSTAEPEHPGPVLSLGAAASGSAASGTATSGASSGGANSGGAPTVTATATAARTASTTVPTVLSVVALVLAAAALAVTLVRRRGARE